MEKREAVVNIFDLDMARVQEIKDRGKPLSKEELMEMQPSETYSLEEYFLDVLPAERQEINLITRPEFPVVDVDIPVELGDEICVYFLPTIKVIERQPDRPEIETCIAQICFRPRLDIA